MPEVLFVTGASSLVGRRVLRLLASGLDPRRDRVVALARAGTAGPLAEELAELPVPAQVLEGDLARMHLGLSSAEYRDVARSATVFWHFAALQDLAADEGLLRAVNVEGTRSVLELAARCPSLRRVHHLSTAFVSGDREGLVLEEELDRGQRFLDTCTRARFAAEKLAREAMAALPVTVYRPSLVVGDPAAGERARLDEPRALALVLVASPVPLPLPGGGRAPLHVVPVEFVAQAAVAIGARAESAGATVHLVYPEPLTAGRIHALTLARLGRSPPPVAMPHRPLEAVLRLPWLASVLRPQRGTLRLVNHAVRYDCRRQRQLLDGSGLSCPPPTAYLDRLVAFARHGVVAGQGAPPREADDPLDPAPTAPPPEPIGEHRRDA